MIQESFWKGNERGKIENILASRYESKRVRDKNLILHVKQPSNSTSKLSFTDSSSFISPFILFDSKLNYYIERGKEHEVWSSRRVGKYVQSKLRFLILQSCYFHQMTHVCRWSSFLAFFFFPSFHFSFSCISIFIPSVTFHTIWGKETFYICSKGPLTSEIAWIV